MTRSHFGCPTSGLRGLEPLLATEARDQARCRRPAGDRRYRPELESRLLVGGCAGSPLTLQDAPQSLRAVVGTGVLGAVFTALASPGGSPGAVLIDGSAVRARRCAGGGKGGSAAKRWGARVVVASPRSMPRAIRSAGLSLSCRPAAPSLSTRLPTGCPASSPPLKSSMATGATTATRSAEGRGKWRRRDHSCQVEPATDALFLAGSPSRPQRHQVDVRPDQGLPGDCHAPP